MKYITFLENFDNSAYIRTFEKDKNNELSLFYHDCITIQKCSGKFAIVNQSNYKIQLITDTLEECLIGNNIDYTVDFSVDTLNDYIEKTYYDWDLDKYLTLKTLDEVIEEFNVINDNKIKPIMQRFREMYDKIKVDFPKSSDRSKFMKKHNYYADERLDENDYYSITKYINSMRANIKKQYPDDYIFFVEHLSKKLDRLY